MQQEDFSRGMLWAHAEEGPSQRTQQALLTASRTLLSLLRCSAPELGASITAAVAVCAGAGGSPGAALNPVAQPDEAPRISVVACTGHLPSFSSHTELST